MTDNQSFVESCNNCKYGFDFSEKEVICRRFPPALHVIDEKLKPYSPTAYKTFWCGEYTRHQIGLEK